MGLVEQALPSDSSATGGHNPRSLYYEPESQRLVFDFAFQIFQQADLSSSSAQSIHLRRADAPDPTGANAGVSHPQHHRGRSTGSEASAGPLREGVTAGRLTGSVVIQKDLKALLKPDLLEHSLEAFSER